MNEKIDFIKGLIHLAEENDLAELSVDFKGIKVSIKKSAPLPQQMPIAVNHIPMTQVQTAPQLAEGSPAERKEDKIPSNLVPVKSPLAGIFYRAPKPNAPPFVNVGDIVEKNHVLCIVEAMKIMNEITSEIKGKIVKICLENGKVANEGDVLMYMEPVD